MMAIFSFYENYFSRIRAYLVHIPNFVLGHAPTVISNNNFLLSANDKSISLFDLDMTVR